MTRPSLILAIVLPTLGCFSWPDPFPTLQRHQAFERDRQAREYHLYAAEADGPRPLVLLLHGGLATIDAFIGETS